MKGNDTDTCDGWAPRYVCGNLCVVVVLGVGVGRFRVQDLSFNDNKKNNDSNNNVMRL